MLFNFVGRGKLVTTDVNFQMYLHVRLNPIHAMYCLPSYRRKHSQGLEICYTILDFFFEAISFTDFYINHIPNKCLLHLLHH